MFILFVWSIGTVMSIIYNLISKLQLIFCSTASSTLNSSAAIILQDFVRPCRPNLSDKSATLISKLLSLGLGLASITLVLFARYFGSGILSVSLKFI